MSLFSMLTGRYPSELEILKLPTVGDAHLPETLERSNYQTATFINDQVFDEAFGYGQDLN